MNDTITCPKCGAENLSGAINCEDCHANLRLALERSDEIGRTEEEMIQHEEQDKAGLESPDSPADSSSTKRPGCVTAYSVLLGISGVSFALFGIGGIISLISGEFDSVLLGLGIIAFCFIVGVLYILFARGLWRLKDWARKTVIVVQSLTLFGVIAFTLLDTLYGSTNAAVGICGIVIGAAIGGYIIYWFASHGEYFN